MRNSLVKALGIGALGCLGTLPAAGVGEAPEIRNGARPVEGVRTVRLEEQWRVGADAEDVMLGWPGQVVTDADGNLLVLDRQLSQVHIFSPQGQYLRSLGREGEGPGEMRRPRDLFLFPDGSLGIVQTSPGKILRLAPDGTPRASVIPGGAAAQGSMAFLFTAACRNGVLLIGGETMLPGEQAIGHERYLDRIREDGTQVVRYLESRVQRGMAGFKWEEEEDYFVHIGGFALGPDGRVYAAPERNRYAVHVFSPEGKLERVITREYEPHRRSAAEKADVNASRRMVINGREIEKVISDREQAVGRLRVDDDGYLWVLPGGPPADAPAGTFEIWDVFDPSGRFVRQVAYLCPGNRMQDHLFRVSEDRALMVRGYAGAGVAVLAGVGGGSPTPPANAGAEGNEETPLELICYRVPK